MESTPPTLTLPEWSREQLRALAHELRMAGDKEALTDEDLAYVKNAQMLTRRRRASGWRSGLPWLAFGLFAALIWWASWAEIEESTRGVGRVIPSQSVQLIQSLEGGILDEIYVQEGQVVEKDAPLVRFRDAIFAANFNENTAKREILEARLCRLDAEAKGLAELKFPAGIRSDLAASERFLFDKRRLDHQTMKASLQSRLTLARREQELLEQGTRSGAISEVELIRVRKEAEQIDGQLRTLDTTLQRESLEMYHQDKAELETVLQALLRDKDRLDRTLIRSPVRGTVNKMHINTVGRVIASGVDIMEVVPVDDTLLVEANVRPSDIAFIHPGQEVMVKFTAYDFSIYGGLRGTLEQISANTITNQNGAKSGPKEGGGESFYQIKVRTDKNSLGKDANGKELILIPGMVAEVDVLTGKRTVLTYLLKPINRARMRALRER